MYSLSKGNDNAPHSMVYWLKWEIHERHMNGQISATPKDHKDFRGVLHFENRKDAQEAIEIIVSKFKEELYQCLQKQQLEIQANLNQQA